jgi:hypothetical protein
MLDLGSCDGRVRVKMYELGPGSMRQWPEDND